VLKTIIQVQTNLWWYEALMARWQIDRSTESALPGLIAGMADPERETRLRLVQCFQDMGTEGLEGMFVALRDADYEVRRKAALALGALGPAAERSVPYLKPLLEDPENIVRFVAEHALKQIRPAEARKWKTKLRMPEKSPERAPSG
jgi:HEAT repeat protein